MRYVLAIGLETEIYKNPSLEVFLNDRFLGMTELDKSVPAELQKHKKCDLLDPWNFKPYSNPEKIYEITLPKKWIIYELDDNTFEDNNTLNIIPKNLRTNNMNGFITKMDKCKIFSVMLVPKKWFSSDGIQNIFSHCDGRNVIIDFDDSYGWPGTAIDTMGRKDIDLIPIYNNPVSRQIVYDKILELYVLQNSPDTNVGGYPLQTHTKLKNYYNQAEKYDNDVMGSKNMVAVHPQKPFEINDNTTLLQIMNNTKVYLDQISAKYQHNEN